MLARKWQLSLFAVLTLVVFPIAIFLIAPTRVTVGEHFAVTLSKLHYSLLSILAAFVFAAIVGGEFDRRALQQRFGFSIAQARRSSGITLGAIIALSVGYLLFPIALFLVQQSGIATPITWIKDVILKSAEPDESNFIEQVYLLSYGAFLTLLFVNLFIDPIAGQVMKEELKVGTKSQLSLLVSSSIRRFLHELTNLFEDNARQLRGVSSLDFEVDSQLNAALTNARLIGLEQTSLEDFGGVIAALREKFVSLQQYAAFLTKVDPETNDGIRLYKRVRRDDISEFVEEAIDLTQKAYRILEVEFTDGLSSSLSADRENVTSAWQKLMVAANTHYEIKD